MTKKELRELKQHYKVLHKTIMKNVEDLHTFINELKELKDFYSLQETIEFWTHEIFLYGYDNYKHTMQNMYIQLIEEFNNLIKEEWDEIKITL